MPTATIETTAERFTRIIAAIDDAWGRKDGESDSALWRRDLKRYYRDMVQRHEGRQARKAVLPDDDIVEVT